MSTCILAGKSLTANQIQSFGSSAGIFAHTVEPLGEAALTLKSCCQRG
jgi:hypothetical protein